MAAKAAIDHEAPRRTLRTRQRHPRLTSPAADFRSATMAQGSDGKFWLSVQDRHLSGNMTLADFQPPYHFDGQQAP